MGVLSPGAHSGRRRVAKGLQRASAEYLDRDCSRDGSPSDSQEEYQEEYRQSCEALRLEGLKEYAALKRQLFARTRTFGGLLATYLFLAVSGEVALSALVGAGCSYGYLVLLTRDVDHINAATRLHVSRARAVQPQPLRTLLLIGAAYRHALKPRLLIAVGLGAAVAAYNSQADTGLSAAEEGALLGGFLSHKVALLECLWDAVKPKFGVSPAPARPQLRQLADVEDL